MAININEGKKRVCTFYLFDLDYNFPKENTCKGKNQKKCEHYENMLKRMNLTLEKVFRNNRQEYQ